MNKCLCGANLTLRHFLACAYHEDNVQLVEWLSDEPSLPQLVGACRNANWKDKDALTDLSQRLRVATNQMMPFLHSHIGTLAGLAATRHELYNQQPGD